MADSNSSSLPMSRPEPRTVVAAKKVELVLITYTNEQAEQITQLGVLGDNLVHLIDGQALGFSRTRTPQGTANEWLAKGVFDKVGRKEKKK